MYSWGTKLLCLGLNLDLEAEAWVQNEPVVVLPNIAYQLRLIFLHLKLCIDSMDLSSYPLSVISGSYKDFRNIYLHEI